MDNFAQAYVQFGDHEINYQRRFPSGTVYYEIKLITLISMYHLKLLVSLDRFIKKY